MDWLSVFLAHGTRSKGAEIKSFWFLKVGKLFKYTSRLTACISCPWHKIKREQNENTVNILVKVVDD